MDSMSNLSKCVILIAVVLILLYFLKSSETNKKELFNGNVKNNDISIEKALESEYNQSSYASGQRGNGEISNLDSFFEDRLAISPENTNDEFTPYDETNNGLAIYKNDSKVSDEDMYNLDNYLPKEQNKDWFDVPPEAVQIKDRHLINVTRPVGIATNASSRRNASHDIRGTPVVPKFTVAPWLQSSIDPDDNINRGKLC